MLDRRTLLLAGAAGLMLPDLRGARAQSPAQIGTFPEGVWARIRCSWASTCR